MLKSTLKIFAKDETIMCPYLIHLRKLPYQDEITLQSGLPIDKVSATLAMMELKGLVHHLAGVTE
jgi:predicted Rossmann fold nucleotide-binding protein DprA/Smf involved in DNA uptake